jgi:hypothetical protein
MRPSTTAATPAQARTRAAGSAGARSDCARLVVNVVRGWLAPRRAATSLLVATAVALAGCSRPPAAVGHDAAGRDGPVIQFEHAAADTPRMPIRVAPGVVVRRAQFGVLKTDDDGNETFVPTTTLPAEDGTVFGWVLQVETDRETLHWQERMRLPKAPEDWGDALEEPDIVISKDGRSVAAQGDDDVQDGELERFYWTLAPGDPAGDYEMDVAVEGRTVAHFRFRVPATVHEKPILVRHEIVGREVPLFARLRPWT